MKLFARPYFVEGRRRWLALTQPWLQLIVEEISTVYARSCGCVDVSVRSPVQRLRCREATRLIVLAKIETITSR